MMFHSPYITQNKSVSKIMFTVLAALLPAILSYCYFYGLVILINLAIASMTALVSEGILLYWRGQPVRFFLKDGSALLTAWLLTLALPLHLPVWLLILGTTLSLILAKQLYGGLGQNIFNPAMVGYAILMIAFPKWMTQWQSPLYLDGLTSATPLDVLKTQLLMHLPIERILHAPIYDTGFFGLSTSTFIISLAYLAGGLLLLQQRIITWHIPLFFLGSLACISSLFYWFNPHIFMTPIFHLLTGASMMGAFFIATDPVSASTTPLGKMIYAGGIGCLIYFIRVFGGYPDGVAFAVLIMNISVPFLDYYTKPAVFGRKGKSHHVSH